MGPLQALTQAYERRLGWAMALPHLGIEGATRLGTLRESLPEPAIAEFTPHTKDRNVLCVEVKENGKTAIVPLLAPCGFTNGHALAKSLIMNGVHPLDIIIATDNDGRWLFRNAVEWMFWTHEDQTALDVPEHVSTHTDGDAGHERTP